MASLQGGKLMIFSGATHKATALATSHSLNFSSETGESSSKDSGRWTEEEVIRLSWDASTDALVEADGGNLEDVFDMWKAGQPVDVVVGIPTNYTDSGVPVAGWTAPTSSADIYYTGKVIIISASFNAPNGSVATMSVSMRGVGELKKQ